MGVEELFYFLREMALQFGRRFQSIGLHFALTIGASLPRFAPRFVATNMDIGRREQVHDLVEHIL